MVKQLTMTNIETDRSVCPVPSGRVAKSMNADWTTRAITGKGL